ncbi:CoA ester lyase [Halomonas alkaliantarctica]|uniref:CoA ester lyase n=1 Tax=Halomonas alkaliantarctica TaxID=232346 RepID=A0ABY8LL87_9GAMM|nr:CoA ester lyase [Halomonas alkaliantarctica]WGI25210.1 CoA ester lyase [Halomonas alkaliantarctica]
MTISSASWRSLLYVPGNNDKFLAKAQTRGADALIIDLEDSVPSDYKQAAREMVAAKLSDLIQGPAQVCIRINGDLVNMADDLRTVVRPGVAAIFLPKCEDAGKVRLVAQALDLLDPMNNVGIVPLIESPGGLIHAYDIARADKRVVALLLGSEDFATSCQITPSEQTLIGAKQQIVYAARAAGISPLGLLDSIANFTSADLEDLAVRSAAFGFSGATSVHPGNVQALNRGFSPSQEDVEWAERVMEELDRAERKSLGAVTLNGRMIDKPVYERAQSILARRLPG